jgi:uncharacterized protein YkwD
VKLARGLFVTVMLAGCAVELDPPSSSEVTSFATVPLTLGVPVSALAAGRGEELRFLIEIPADAGALTFALDGGTGDADLYVRFGAEPTRTEWDHRPRRRGNAETVELATPPPGTYFVMVRGYRAFAGVSLVVTAADGDEPAPVCDESAWPAGWVAFEDEVVAAINQRRAAGATCGGVAKPAVGPVAVNTELRTAARCHSLDMAVQGYFSHTSQDGRSPWDRIDDAGYTGSATGENIAAGYATAAAVVEGWMTSTGHCNNIMNGGSNETGVGYAFQAGSPYGRYWTQTFGRR